MSLGILLPGRAFAGLATIALLCSCSQGEGAMPEGDIEAAFPEPVVVPASALPLAAQECARQLDSRKGPGHTIENAASVELICRDARADASDECQDFLRAAGRAGFKAASNIGEWSDAGTAQYLDALNEAGEARPLCAGAAGRGEFR